MFLRRTAHVLAVVGVVATIVFFPAVADAAPRPPTPAPSAPATPQPALTPPPVSPDDQPHGGEGLIDAVLGKQAKLPGEAPLSHYDIGYSTGGFMGSFTPNAMLGWLTDLVFTAARWVTAFALWVINYALAFSIARFLTSPAADVATGYQHAVTRLGLQWVFLVLAVAYAGWHTLRGRAAHGVGEALVSFLVATLLAGILAAPASTLLGNANGNGGALGAARDASMAVAGITLSPSDGGGERADSASVSAPVLAKLQHTLIDIPHQVIDWGQVLEAPGRPPACLAAYRDLVAHGPWGTSNTPRDTMTARGCKNLADFNAHPTPDRLLVAFLVLVAVLLACVLLIVMGFTVVGVQITLAILVCFTPLVLASGLLPGSGRQLLWRWATGILRALAAVVMTVAILCVVIALASAILRSDDSMPLAVRMGLLDIFMITAFIFRRRLMEAGRRAATGMGQRMAATRIGGSRGLAGIAGGAAGLAAADAWGDHAERNIGNRARYQARQVVHGHLANRRLARTLRQPNQRNGAAPSLRKRITTSRPGRIVKTTAKLTGIALAATVGAPVYLPRAAKVTKVATRARAAAVRKRLATARTSARAFRREYTHNLAAPGRLAKRAAQRRRTPDPALTRTPPPPPHRPNPTPPPHRADPVPPPKPDPRDPPSRTRTGSGTDTAAAIRAARKRNAAIARERAQQRRRARAGKQSFGRNTRRRRR
jgi:hypothetical protein